MATRLWAERSGARYGQNGPGHVSREGETFDLSPKRLDGSFIPRALVSGFSDLDVQPKVKSEWSCLLFYEVPSWRGNDSNGDQCGYTRQRECPDSFYVEVTGETLDRTQLTVTSL
jgi:hypothetical protein